MKVLVTGGTGFIGRHVVWRSLLSGYDTVFTGRSPEAAALVMEMARRVSPDRLPVFHPEGHPLGEPFDVVIDCAGKVDLVGSRADYVAANVDRTSAAWAHARERGARTFVSVSSASVLFACRDQLGLTDGVPATPPGIHPYADSKALSETMLWARRGQGPAIRIIRPRGVYGPYDSGVLPRILKVARRLGGRFPLPAPGALASMTAASNLAHAVLLAAEDQTAGRGRLGKGWHSKAGQSLTFSLAMPLAPANWSGLSLAVGVSLAHSLHPDVRLKWPNDLWLHQRKLGGILVETASHGETSQGRRMVVIGVGINVARPEVSAVAALVPDGSAVTAMAPAWLSEVLVCITQGEVLERVAPALVRDIQAFATQGFAAFAQRFAQLDALQGLAVQLTDGTRGTACGVNEDGALQVLTERGMQTVTSAEVSVRPC